MHSYVLLVLSVSNFCFGDESDKSLFPPLPMAPVSSKNELCTADSVTYLENLDNITLWSYQMWEATERSTAGLLQGNRFHMGDFDECMKVKAPFKTRFCLIIVTANITGWGPPRGPRALDTDPQGTVVKRIIQSYDISQMNRDAVRVGWCVPASCTNEDLSDVLEDHFNQTTTYLTTNYNVTYSGMVVEKLCQTQGEKKPFNLLDIAFCSLLALLVFTVIVATLYQYKIEDELTEKEQKEYQKRKWHRILIGFSAKKNLNDLARPDVSNPALASLYGLRTISVIMITVGHRFMFSAAGPMLNFDEIEIAYGTLLGNTIFQASLFVDTFFTLSGILVAYGLMKQLEKQYMNPFHLIFLRYIRLTPAYAFVIFYTATVFVYMGNGPLWKAIVHQQSENCINNWWTNLLYVNNFINIEDMCMMHTWYLACDFHFFVIAAFVIVLFFKNKMFGSLLFTLCFLLSMAVPLIITVVFMRPPILLFFPDLLLTPSSHPDFVLTYSKSHSRGTPYCIGMILGYIYYKMKDSKEKLSKIKSHCITLISVLLLFTAIVSTMPFYNRYHEYDIIEAAIYAGFNRLTWSLGTVGLLLTASFGHITFLQKILSWSPFVPISKLAYGAYLIHASFQFRPIAMTLTPERFDIITLLCVMLGDGCASFIGSLIIYLLVEIPIMKLFKEVLTFSTPVASPPAPNRTLESVNNKESSSRL